MIGTVWDGIFAPVCVLCSVSGFSAAFLFDEISWFYPTRMILTKLSSPKHNLDSIIRTNKANVLSSTDSSVSYATIDLKVSVFLAYCSSFVVFLCVFVNHLTFLQCILYKGGCNSHTVAGCKHLCVDNAELARLAKRWAYLNPSPSANGRSINYKTFTLGCRVCPVCDILMPSPLLDGHCRRAEGDGQVINRTRPHCLTRIVSAANVKYVAFWLICTLNPIRP